MTKLLEVVSYYFLTRGEGLYCFIRCVRTSNDLHGDRYKLPDNDFRVKMVHKKKQEHSSLYLFFIS